MQSVSTTMTSRRTSPFSTESFDNSSSDRPKFTPVKVLGHGAFGYVFEAYDHNRKCKVALKRTQKSGNIISREYEVLTLMKGKSNVIQLLDLFYTFDSKQRVIQNAVFEFCDRSLEDVLKDLDDKDEYIDVKELKRLMGQLLTGLANMHEEKVIHRDLKPENILIKEGEVKICDLGSSKVLDEENFMNTPYVVSRFYRAPELILGSNKYTEAIDMWATGCILFELITRTPLFPGDSEGLQILEYCMILGSPTDHDIEKLKGIIDPTMICHIKKCGSLKPQDVSKLINSKEYSSEVVY